MVSGYPFMDSVRKSMYFFLTFSPLPILVAVIGWIGGKEICMAILKSALPIAIGMERI